MVIQSICKFAIDASAPETSKVFLNTQGSILALSIDGANGEYYIEGRLNKDDAWRPIAGINMKNLQLARGIFKDSGSYELDIIGARELRSRIVSVDGTVSITGQIISTEEK